MEVLKTLSFTPETPFGLRLYPYFEQVYQAVTGQKASDFVFTPGLTPLSTNNEGKYFSGRRRHLLTGYGLGTHCCCS